MRTRWLLVFCLLVLALAGCGADRGGRAPQPAAYPGGGGYGYGYPTTTSAGRSHDAPASAPVSGGEAMGPRSIEPAPAPAPQDRPGLGTEWGETRTSHVRDVTFSRADPDRPFAVATLHYNDQSGVQALSNYHGGGRAMREVSPMRSGAITIQVRDGGGSPLSALFVGDRTYVIGEHGQRYVLVLTNHSPHRFEVVTTVDGLDVINGRTGTLSNRGYVLMPYATLEIDGFRQSQEAVAAFRFGRVGDSYAAQTGSARNVGVIGFAFFAERGDTYSEEELYTRDTASPFPADPRYARPPR